MRQRSRSMDKIILGENCYIDDVVGAKRPNDNQMIVGSTGTGKSMSVMLPTILNMSESSMIGTYSKCGEAWDIAEYQKKKGYFVEVCDLTDPDKSTVGFDPLYYIRCRKNNEDMISLDIEDLSKSIVLADPNSNNPKDIYWNDSATTLLTALIKITLDTVSSPTMSDVLDLFDRLYISESGKGITTSLDRVFDEQFIKGESKQAVAAFNDYRQLPYGTAGCVRDSLAKALRRLFPNPIRKMMKKNENVDFIKIASNRSSLIIITSPVNKSLYLFANLIFNTAIKQLLEYAEKMREQRLPYPVKLMFDDFACAAKINEYPNYISIFRSAGISALMMIQSEEQLKNIYAETGASTILNNCSCYVYFPGGMDLTTCRNMSQRLNKSLSDIMYAPMNRVIVMRSGEKPVVVQRYDVLNSREYKEFQRLIRKEHGRIL